MMVVSRIDILNDARTETYSITATDGGDVLHCTCPAWKFSRLPITRRTCKHIRFAQRLVAVGR